MSSQPDEPTPAALREQIERTRDELGRTVEALAAKADVKAQATEKAARVTGRIRGGIEHAATPRAERTAALLAVGAAVLVILLVRHNRGHT
ncbi:DUF3618 domain-containing protein [Streptomyces sp. NPDC097617]|uniref:DUF3618 domain-containing protein n=1 Tax=Streptomyces sp. NPDC097617 TaxID=3366091 RepID=UPI00381CAC23